MSTVKTSSQWVHRHPERGWEPCGKKQAENVCPFGEANHVTLEDGVDADEAAGRLNEHEYGNGNSSAKPKKKKAPHVVNGIDRSKVTYVDWDKIDNLGYSSSHEDMEAVGAEVNAEVNKRLGYDPAELDYRELKDKTAEIQKTNREVMAEIVKTTGSKSETVYGPRAKDLEESIAVLPDDAKSYISDLHIQAKTMNKNNRTTLGQHSFGRVPVGEKLQTSEKFDYDVPHNVPEGEIFSGLLKFELEEGSISFTGHVKDTSEVQREVDGRKAYKMKRVWIGHPTTEGGRPAKKAPKGWRKISDTTEVWGISSWSKDSPVAEKVTVNKPSYEIAEEVTVDGSVLKVPAVEKESPGDSFREGLRSDQQSIALHEYTHAIQRKYRMELADATKQAREQYYEDYKLAKDKERVAAKEFGVNAVETKEFSRQVEEAGEKLYATDLSQEEIFWGEIKGERIKKSFHGTTDTRFEGFPDSYMGDSSKKELWTVATENFFYTDAPRSLNSLYGKKKAENPNTERIRNWVVGQWIQVAQLGASKQKSENAD